MQGKVSSVKHPVQMGDTVRVTAPGKFQGQEVDVLAVQTKSWRHRTTYQLNTKWDAIPYPAWFVEDEFEIVESEGCDA